MPLSQVRRGSLTANFLNLLGGEFAARSIQAVAMIILTRQLGTDGIGVYGLATAIAAYGQLCILLGIDPIAIRGLHQRKIEAQEATGRIFALRLIAAAVLIALAACYAMTGRGEGYVVLVLSLSYLPIAMTPRWLLLATGEGRALAIGGVLSQLTFLATVIWAPHQAVFAAAGVGAGEALNAAFCHAVARQHAGEMRLAWDSRFKRELLREARPVAISLVIGTMMTNLDVLLLAILGRQDQIGLYVSAYRPLTFFAPLLGVLQYTILPRYSAAWPDFSKIRVNVRAVAIATGGTLLLAAGLLSWQSPLVLRLLFGAQFLKGTPLLRVLVWTLVPQGIRCVLRQVLIAFHMERRDLRNAQAAVLTNAAVDLALIPRFGALGCAYSTVISEVVFLAATWAGVRRVRRERL